MDITVVTTPYERLSKLNKFVFKISQLSNSYVTKFGRDFDHAIVHGIEKICEIFSFELLVPFVHFYAKSTSSALNHFLVNQENINNGEIYKVAILA